MLTDAELKDFWSIFKDKPLFAKWQDAEAQVSPQIEKRIYKSNQAIFRPGSLAEYIYLVGQGTVVQSVPAGDTPWLRRELKRGNYFGHQALFSDKFAAETVAATECVIYMLPAQTLRLAMEAKRRSLRGAAAREARRTAARHPAASISLGRGFAAHQRVGGRASFNADTNLPLTREARTVDH